MIDLNEKLPFYIEPKAEILAVQKYVKSVWENYNESTDTLISNSYNEGQSDAISLIRKEDLTMPLLVATMHREQVLKKSKLHHVEIYYDAIVMLFNDLTKGLDRVSKLLWSKCVWSELIGSSLKRNKNLLSDNLKPIGLDDLLVGYCDFDGLNEQDYQAAANLFEGHNSIGMGVSGLQDMLSVSRTAHEITRGDYSSAVHLARSVYWHGVFLQINNNSVNLMTELTSIINDFHDTKNTTTKPGIVVSDRFLKAAISTTDINKPGETIDNIEKAIKAHDKSKAGSGLLSDLMNDIDFQYD